MIFTSSYTCYVLIYIHTYITKEHNIFNFLLFYLPSPYCSEDIEVRLLVTRNPPLFVATDTRQNSYGIIQQVIKIMFVNRFNLLFDLIWFEMK